MPQVSYSVDDRIASIRMRAPAEANALTPIMRRELNAAFQAFRDDPDAWVAVVSGEGDNFCVGSGDSAPERPEVTPERLRLWAGGYVEVWKPTIAAVQGMCRGEGFALALGCDLRVAQAGTQFEPAFGGSSEPLVTAAWLINRVGLSKAFELLWLGEPIGAEEALSLGLVNRIAVDGQADSPPAEEGRLPMDPMQTAIHVPGGDAVSAAFAFAKELLQYAPVTRKFQKETALRSIGVPFAFAQTLELGPNPYASEDRVEGTRAFVENRRPVWRDR